MTIQEGSQLSRAYFYGSVGPFTLEAAMDDTKKQIILNEIHEWRKNKLLPESYCVFLLNLYSEGQQTEDSNVKINRKKWFVNILMIVTILLIGINFNSFPLPMQIILGGIFLLCLYGFGFYYKQMKPIVSLLLLGLASVCLLFACFILVPIDQSMLLLLFLGGVCITWLVTGLYGNVTFLLYCSLIGLFFIYGWAIHPRIIEYSSSFLTQLYWLPLSILSAWFSTLLNQRKWRIGPVIALVSVLIWIAPEVQSYIISGWAPAQLQTLFVLKIIVGGIIILQYRMKILANRNILNL